MGSCSELPAANCEKHVPTAGVSLRTHYSMSALFWGSVPFLATSPLWKRRCDTSAHFFHGSLATAGIATANRTPGLWVLFRMQVFGGITSAPRAALHHQAVTYILENQRKQKYLPHLSLRLLAQECKDKSRSKWEPGGKGGKGIAFMFHWEGASMVFWYLKVQTIGLSLWL